MRATFNSHFRESSLAVEETATRLIDAQRRVASGRRMDDISDDPGGTASALKERTGLAQVDQYSRAANSVTSRLTVVDGVLSDIVETLTAARVAAMSARGDTKTAAERTAAAERLAGLRDSLVDTLNTSFQGVYLFGGTDTATRPYVPVAGIPAYTGNAAEAELEIGDGRTATITFAGSTITQGSDAQDVFQVIDALLTAINAADEDGIATGMQGLQRAFDRTIAAQSRVGNDMQVVDTAKLRLQQVRLSGVERLSRLEDVNMAEAVTQMSNADAAYRASLGAISTAARVSLLDYLK